MSRDSRVKSVKHLKQISQAVKNSVIGGGGQPIMARLEDAIAYQESQHELLCSTQGCGSETDAQNEYQKQADATLSPSYSLPESITLDAIVYASVIVVFYVILVVLLVGTNLHRFRRKKHPLRRSSSTISLTPAAKDLKVSLAILPEDEALHVVSIV